jgi:hypothetical protein
LVDEGITRRVIIKNNKGEVVYIMSNEGHPTQWVSVNPDMGTRDGGEYETTTQSTQDIDALTVHSKPRERRKSWDAGLPPADTDAPDTSRATGQPTADDDDAQTHSTHAHVTHTYMQDARKAAEGHVHPLTPTPRQTQIIPPSPIPHTRAAERAALAALEPSSLSRTRHIFINEPWVGTRSSTPGADTNSAIANVGKGQQENLVRDSEIRTGGVADGGGGTELLALQDEPHQEEAGEQASHRGMGGGGGARGGRGGVRH